MRKKNQEPDMIIKTSRSEIHLYSHYEEGPEKVRQAKEEFDRGLRYIAKQGGWLDTLEERDASLARLMQLLPLD